jgi:hypothetical protein
MMSQPQSLQQQQVPADKQITCTGPAAIWAEIMSVVQTAPISYQRAAPLVQFLSEQFQAATQQDGPLSNGVDTPTPPPVN